MVKLPVQSCYNWLELFLRFRTVTTWWPKISVLPDSWFIYQPGNHHPKPPCIDNMETLQRALSSHSKLSSNQISLFPNPSTYQNFCFISKHKEFLQEFWTYLIHVFPLRFFIFNGQVLKYHVIGTSPPIGWPIKTYLQYKHFQNVFYLYRNCLWFISMNLVLWEITRSRSSHNKCTFECSTEWRSDMWLTSLIFISSRPPHSIFFKNFTLIFFSFFFLGFYFFLRSDWDWK